MNLNDMLQTIESDICFLHKEKGISYQTILEKWLDMVNDLENLKEKWL